MGECLSAIDSLVMELLGADNDLDNGMLLLGAEWPLTALRFHNKGVRNTFK